MFLVRGGALREVPWGLRRWLTSIFFYSMGLRRVCVPSLCRNLQHNYYYYINKLYLQAKLSFWFSLCSDLFYFSFLSSNFWSISRREAGCWWDLICSRFSFLSFALARLHNMLPMMNTFAALNLLYCLFFASFLIPVSAFLFSMYLHSFFTLLFTFT